MSCPECGAELSSGARFCPSCGEPVAEATHVHDAVEGRAVTDDEEDAPLFPSSDRTHGATSATSGSTATGTLVACPACDAPNAAARMLCGRCGADLVTGEESVTESSVVRPGPAVDLTGDVDVRDRSDGPRTAVIVAAIVVVGALVGVAIGIWAVRAGEPDEPAAPVFDPAAYPDDPVDLRVGGVGASSTRSAAGDTDYEPANMVDADLATAWSHDPAAQAATDVDLAFALDQPAWVTAVVVANGAQADPAAFEADSRVASMLLVVDGEPVVDMQLLDETGYQRVPLPEPVLAQTVRFVVTDTVAGDTFDEVSLSEVAFVGHVATGADVDLVSGSE